MVPMMYPFTLVAKRARQHPLLYQLYMANPLAEAVLLLQRLLLVPDLIDDPDGRSARRTSRPTCSSAA